MRINEPCNRHMRSFRNYRTCTLNASARARFRPWIGDRRGLLFLTQVAGVSPLTIYVCRAQTPDPSIKQNYTNITLDGALKRSSRVPFMNRTYDMRSRSLNVREQRTLRDA